MSVIAMLIASTEQNFFTAPVLSQWTTRFVATLAPVLSQWTTRFVAMLLTKSLIPS
jgi:hypothetical protein